MQYSHPVIFVHQQLFSLRTCVVLSLCRLRWYAGGHLYQSSSLKYTTERRLITKYWVQLRSTLIRCRSFELPSIYHYDQAYQNQTGFYHRHDRSILQAGRLRSIILRSRRPTIVIDARVSSIVGEAVVVEVDLINAVLEDGNDSVKRAEAVGIGRAADIGICDGNYSIVSAWKSKYITFNVKTEAGDLGKGEGEHTQRISSVWWVGRLGTRGLEWRSASQMVRFC